MPTQWQSGELKTHPLAGRIWSARKGDFVDAQEYGTNLAKARFILLGEVHDNPDAHRLQAWAIRTVSKLRGARLVEGAAQADIVAFEMLTNDEADKLDLFYGRNTRVPRSRTAADFGRIVVWEKLGWPNYALYEPIVAAALDAQLRITPASPSRDENRKISKEGLASLPGDAAKRLALDAPLDTVLAADLAAEIRDSHCGLLPDAALANMSFVQRLRDARMADAMLVSETKGAILVAGNGHARKDRGVPWYLVRRGVTPADIVSVHHTEVRAGKDAAADYGLKPGTISPAADYVVFIPRQSRPDPCEEMRRQMEAIKARRGATRPPG